MQRQIDSAKFSTGKDLWMSEDGAHRSGFVSTQCGPRSLHSDSNGTLNGTVGLNRGFTKHVRPQTESLVRN